MKKILFLCFFISFYTFTKALNTFEKVIETLGSAGALCVQETFDGGFVYCGKSNLIGNDVMIVKSDSVGTIERAKTYSGPGTESAMFIKKLPDSSYRINAVYNSKLDKNSGQQVLDASKLANGVYFIRIISEGSKSRQQKLIINK